jgi:transposase
MAATRTTNCSSPEHALYLAFELGWKEWKLAFSTGTAQPPRLRNLRGRDLNALQQEIAVAKARFGLPADAPVRTCYEAGRDGFWLARYLDQAGIDNQVVDASSIEVNRRKRRAKTDRLDAGKLLAQLIRWHGGERSVWRVVRVPAVSDEDRRQLHRDLLDLKTERTRHVNRIKSLLATQGLEAEVDDRFPERLNELRCWDAQPVPDALQQRLRREFERWQLVQRQVAEVEQQQHQQLRHGSDRHHEMVRQLLGLKAIGPNSAWLFVMEFFAWRQLENRRQVAGLAGLAPSPYQSGSSSHEQGISKAGNRRLRTMAIEIAWGWLRWQPDSKLSRWFNERFGKGSSRQRRIGIVALARKVLVALWRYLHLGEVPEGAALTDWKRKVRGRKAS